MKEAYCFVSMKPLVVLHEADLLGLVCYMTTKILIYYFLVERAVRCDSLPHISSN